MQGGILMNRIIVLICLVSLSILLLSGCEAKVCRYVNGKGNDYSVLNREKIKDMNPYGASMPVASIGADSMGELIQKVKKTEFTDLEIYTIGQMYTDKQDRVILPDLDNILEVVLPDDAQWTRALFYTGGGYGYKNAYMRAEVGTLQSLRSYAVDDIEAITESAVITENSTQAEIDEIRYKQYSERLGETLGTRVYYFRVEKCDQVFYVAESYTVFTNGAHKGGPIQSEVYIKIDTDLWVCVTKELGDTALPIDWITAIEVRPFRQRAIWIAVSVGTVVVLAAGAAILVYTQKRKHHPAQT